MLGELHKAVLAGLRSTFGGVEVHEHGGEVDVDTIRRRALGRVNMLVTVAASDLVPDSSPEILRACVRLGIFVIAGPIDVKGDAGPTSSIDVAAKYTEKLQQLLALQTWDLVGVEPVALDTIVARNLGVGIKGNREALETSRLSLWVVWWEQVVSLGEPLDIGALELPEVELIEGAIEDQLEQGQIGVLEPLNEE